MTESSFINLVLGVGAGAACVLLLIGAVGLWLTVQDWRRAGGGDRRGD